jgi:hypothetical protein
MSRWTAVDVAAATTRIRNAIAAPLEGAGLEIVDRRRAKYRNIPNTWQGQRFDSKRELRCFQDFEMLRITGSIRAVIRQVSLPLPSTSRRIRIDFLVIDNEGKYFWYDAKGYETAHWAAKRQHVFDAYGITIKLI